MLFDSFSGGVATVSTLQEGSILANMKEVRFVAGITLYFYLGRMKLIFMVILLRCTTHIFFFITKLLQVFFLDSSSHRTTILWAIPLTIILKVENASA